MPQVVSHHCGVSWTQVGNRTGHCAGCHRTFSSIAAFDQHQSMQDGKSVCAPPSLAVRKDGSHLYEWDLDPNTGATVWSIVPTEAQRASLEKLRRSA